MVLVRMSHVGNLLLDLLGRYGERRDPRGIPPLHVVTKDGGITSKGLHEGAPNYETCKPRRSAGVGVGDTFTRTNYESLAAPMDWKDRGWCSGGCPSWGTPCWV